MYVITGTNHVNWHRGNLRSDRENTENLKMQFEWVYLAVSGRLFLYSSERAGSAIE